MLVSAFKHKSIIVHLCEDYSISHSTWIKKFIQIILNELNLRLCVNGALAFARVTAG